MQVVFGVVGGGESADGFPFVGVVRVVCEPDASGRAEVKVVEGHLPFYQVTIESASICTLFGESKLYKRSLLMVPIRVLSWMVFILILYLLLGSVYRAVWLGRRGVEMVPNHEIVLQIVGVVKDFCVNLRNRLRGRPGYQQL